MMFNQRIYISCCIKLYQYKYCLFTSLSWAHSENQLKFETEDDGSTDHRFVLLGVQGGKVFYQVVLESDSMVSLIFFNL